MLINIININIVITYIHIVLLGLVLIYIYIYINMSRLYVANVASDANMEEVHDMFGECGKLKSFNVQNGCGYIVS